MILVPEKFVYVLNPRTGSRAMEQAFLDHVPGAQKIGRHHGFTPKYGLPVYATTRNPVDLILSHWWKTRDTLTLEQYIERRTPRLHLFADQIDRYFLYDDGLEAIFAQLGYPDVKTEKIGGSDPDRDYFNKAQIHLIKRAFPDDVALYEGVTQSR